MSDRLSSLDASAPTGSAPTSSNGPAVPAGPPGARDQRGPRRPPPAPPQRDGPHGATQPAESPTRGVELPCRACGAALSFRPGTLTLACHHCGGENMIGPPQGEIVEYDYEAALRELERSAPRTRIDVVACGSCGASTELAAETATAHCPYCGTHLNATHATVEVIRPTAVLPFKIGRDAAEASFQKWLGGRWFAPSSLRRDAATERQLEGVYVPHWLFDARAATAYRGWHGRHYWVTVGSGNNRRRVRRTSWSRAIGRVRRQFRDVMVVGSGTEIAALAGRLSGWELSGLVPYDDRFLAGLLAERHTVDLRDGFLRARGVMLARIDRDIRADIGGDVQQIDERRTSYTDIRFRQALLPLWIRSYRFKGKTYHFAINGCSGAVVGTRPYCVKKILVAVGAAIAAIAIIILLAL